MYRCAHLYDSGRQCGSEAIAGTDFCEDHGGLPVFDRLDDHPFRKLILRLVALILLIVFLIPFYHTLKALYLGAPIESQEAW